MLAFINWFALMNNVHQFMDFIRYAPVNTWYVKRYRLLIYLIIMLITT